MATATYPEVSDEIHDRLHQSREKLRLPCRLVKILVGREIRFQTSSSRQKAFTTACPENVSST